MIDDTKQPPTTAAGDIGVVMLRAGEQRGDAQWLDLDGLRVEWEANTMPAVFPAITAERLIACGLARVMTPTEAWAFNKRRKMRLY